MTMVFIYNTICTFDPKTGKIVFTECSWQAPIEAINKIKLVEVEGKKIEIQIKLDA